MRAAIALSWPRIFLLTLVWFGMNLLGNYLWVEFCIWQFDRLSGMAEYMESKRIRGWTMLPVSFHWFVLALGFAYYAPHHRRLAGVVFGAFVGLVMLSLDLIEVFRRYPDSSLDIVSAMFKYTLHGLVAGWLYRPGVAKGPPGSPPLPS